MNKIFGYFSFYAIVIIVSLVFSFKSCSKGKDPSDYEYICIEGHTYHTVNFGQKMAIAIKLDDEGRPVKCQ